MTENLARACDASLARARLLTVASGVAAIDPGIMTLPSGCSSGSVVPAQAVLSSSDLRPTFPLSHDPVLARTPLVLPSSACGGEVGENDESQRNAKGPAAYHKVQTGQDSDEIVMPMLPPPPRIYCPVCNKAFIRAGYLQRHMHSQHSETTERGAALAPAQLPTPRNERATKATSNAATLALTPGTATAANALVAQNQLQSQSQLQQQAVYANGAPASNMRATPGSVQPQSDNHHHHQQQQQQQIDQQTAVAIGAGSSSMFTHTHAQLQTLHASTSNGISPAQDVFLGATPDLTTATPMDLDTTTAPSGAASTSTGACAGGESAGRVSPAARMMSGGLMSTLMLPDMGHMAADNSALSISNQSAMSTAVWVDNAGEYGQNHNQADDELKAGIWGDRGPAVQHARQTAGLAIGAGVEDVTAKASLEAMGRLIREAPVKGGCPGYMFAPWALQLGTKNRNILASARGISDEEKKILVKEARRYKHNLSQRAYAKQSYVASSSSSSSSSSSKFACDSNSRNVGNVSNSGNTTVNDNGVQSNNSNNHTSSVALLDNGRATTAPAMEGRTHTVAQAAANLTAEVDGLRPVQILNAIPPADVAAGFASTAAATSVSQENAGLPAAGSAAAATIATPSSSMAMVSIPVVMMPFLKPMGSLTAPSTFLAPATTTIATTSTTTSTAATAMARATAAGIPDDSLATVAPASFPHPNGAGINSAIVAPFQAAAAVRTAVAPPPSIHGKAESTPVSSPGSFASFSAYSIPASSGGFPSQTPTSPGKEGRSNGGPKMMACPDCNKTFAQTGNLTRHRLVHTQEKPFVCGTCGKGFSQKSHLKTHGNFHTGVKPFQCVICDKKFTQHGHLKQHLANHTKATAEGRALRCSAGCTNKMFLNRGDLHTHMQEAHGRDGGGISDGASKV